MINKTCVFAFLFVVLAFGFACAHPPTDIVISYDPTAKILKAVIYHNVANPEKHFIKKVDVSLNSKEIISQAISRQDNLATQTVSYLIPDVKLGDTLSVEAYCNIIGKLEKEIQAGK